MSAAAMALSPFAVVHLNSGQWAFSNTTAVHLRQHVKARSSVPSSSSSSSSSASENKRSIICPNCDGDGAKPCSSCKGDGLNLEDHFGGRFKTGEVCWLCRGKKKILCGNCNGAGFVGGFLSTIDE